MSLDFLGLDTSNYTTSAALYDGERAVNSSMLLPVKQGEAGVRQSDAVFHHTRQLPLVFEGLEFPSSLRAVAASVRPRNVKGSYMPCFLCGQGAAEMIARTHGIPCYHTSHQIGHILAALYSAKRLDMIDKPFIAFHVSGGTTDCLYCTPHRDDILEVREIGTSLDLKAGQLIDRTGLMLGLDFPCGIALEKLAVSYDGKIKAQPVMKGENCCLSGFENKVQQLLREGHPREEIAYYTLDAVYRTVLSMTRHALDEYGSLPVIYAGGVMSDRLIQQRLAQSLDNVYFSEPQFSRDNAAGIAVFAYLMSQRRQQARDQ